MCAQTGARQPPGMTDYQTDRGWVGVPVATAVPVEEERHAAPSSEISEPSTSGLSQREDGFIQHKVRPDLGCASVAAAPAVRTVHQSACLTDSRLLSSCQCICRFSRQTRLLALPSNTTSR